MKKLNFKELQGALSRNEMKKIMAGSHGCIPLNGACNPPATVCCGGMICAAHRCVWPT